MSRYGLGRLRDTLRKSINPILPAAAESDFMPSRQASRHPHFRQSRSARLSASRSRHLWPQPHFHKFALLRKECGFTHPSTFKESSITFKPYTPPNEGASLLTVDRDLCWRLNPRGLVTPEVIGAICWARNNFSMSTAQHLAILVGLGLEYHQIPGGVTVLRPKDAHRIVLSGSNSLSH
jgi:hypothetical protein